MKKILLFLIAFTLVLSSCKEEDDPTQKLTLDIEGLENLGTDYVYEGWIIVGGSPISSGRFTVDDNGDLSQSYFNLDEDDLSSATTFVLTIEPSTGDDPAPSDVHILAGDFSGNSGSVSVSHAAALGDSFENAQGKFILATPSDGNGDMNEESGVWWLDNSSGSPEAGLMLPLLPAGWKYEGWAVVDGTAISTGTFTQVDSADDFSGYSGTAGTPGFPGEDLLMNAPSGVMFPADLRGNLAVISIEPSPDNSAAPFLLKPLVSNIAEDAPTHSVLNMNLNLDSFPTGTFNRS
jgi:hypothetical protein